MPKPKLALAPAATTIPVAVIVACALATWAIGGCAGDSREDDAAPPPSLRFDTTVVRIVTRADTIRLAVELAVSTEQKTTGLMERRHLPDSAGMLFVYDSLQPPDAGFWMYRTRIPLDIAFIDASGRIRAIKQMAPCEAPLAEGCPSYPPGVPYQYALEVNAGFFARRGVAVGDSVGVAAASRPR